MRPTAERQSALRAPLNYALGTETGVRLLRCLSQTATPLGRAELARRAELNASGVRRALDGLEQLGIVESVGTGTQRLVRLRREHPLASDLVALFRAEGERFDHMIQRLKQEADLLSPVPKAVWMQGPVARARDKPGDQIDIGVLTGPANVDAAVAQLQSSAAELMEALDVVVEVRGWTVADLEAARIDQLADLEDVVILSGPPPLSLYPSAGAEPGTGKSGKHAEHDQRNLALAQAIADRLTEDPTLVERAREYIQRRSRLASTGERHELEEWTRLLESLSIPRLREFLVDPRPRATRLRQTLPFLEALSKAERDRILQEASQ